MAKFKVGDSARFVASRVKHSKSLVGCRCIITEVDVTNHVDEARDYAVYFPDVVHHVESPTGRWVVFEWQLEPYVGSSPLGSWNDIEQLLGWKRPVIDNHDHVCKNEE